MKNKIYGHRGARGLYPENTLIGFEKTFEMPLQGIELDIVVSKDHELVIAHQPWMKHLTCTAPGGLAITAKNEQTHNLYELNYSEILGYDCGQRRNLRFPFQRLNPAQVPLLSEFFELMKKNTNPDYWMLLEMKSESDWYGKFQPKPDDYAKLVVDFLALHTFTGTLLIQSFDPNLLNAIHKIKQFTHVGLLVENELSITENLALLDFKPTHYNMYHPLITEDSVLELTELGLETITFTVNSTKELDRLNSLGLNKIITDYPDLFL